MPTRKIGKRIWIGKRISVDKKSSINMNKYLFHYCYKHDNSNNRYNFHLFDLQRLKIRIPSVGKVMGKWSLYIKEGVNLIQPFWIQFATMYQNP